MRKVFAVMLLSLLVLLARCGPPPPTTLPAADPTTPPVPGPSVSFPPAQIVFFSDQDGGLPRLYIMNADGTDVRKLVRDDTIYIVDMYSYATSPVGPYVAVSLFKGHEPLGPWVLTADGSEQIRLRPGASSLGQYPTWSFDGRFIAYNSGGVDADTLLVSALDGSQVASFDFPTLRIAAVFGSMTWSPDGTRLAFTAFLKGTEQGEQTNLDIYVVSLADGSLTQLTNSPAQDNFPKWSPDGARILFQSFRDGNGELYLVNPDGADLVNLTQNPAQDAFGMWSPDGEKIAFTSDRDGDVDLYVMNSDGSDVKSLADDPGDETFPSWSPDGQWLAFSHREGENWEVYLVGLDGSRPFNLTQNPATDLYPQWVP